MAKQKMLHTVMGGCTLLLTLMFWTVPPAYAGESEDYFQITCKPESDYFSLRTLTLLQPDCKNMRNCKIKDSGNFDSRLLNTNQFIEHPYTCKLQSSSVAISLLNYQQARGRGQCGGLSRFDIGVRINDKVVRELSAYGFNRCEHGETHLIEFFGTTNYFRDCALPNDSQFSPKCSTERISADDTPGGPQAVTTK